MKSVSRRDVLRWMASAVPASVVASRMVDDMLNGATAHPRLLFTSDNIPAIRAKLTAYYGSSSPYPDIRGTLQTALNDADAVFGTIADVTSARYYASTFAFLSQILPCAGFSSTHSPAQHGAESARLLQLWVNGGSVGGGSAGGWPENMLAFAYDWAYAYLSPELKAAIVALMRPTATVANGQYNSPWGASGSTDVTTALLFACAIANDGIDDAWANTELGKFATRVISLSGVVGEESAVTHVGPDTMGCSLQSGLNYANYQWPPWVQHLEAYRTAMGLSPSALYTSDFDAVPSALYWWVYSLLPYAWQNTTYPHGFRWGLMRTQYSSLDPTAAFPAGPLPFMFAGVYKTIYPKAAQLAMWYGRHRITRDGYPPTGLNISNVWVYRFLCEDPTIAEASPASLNLPLSASFGDGRYGFKSGWDADGTTNTNWAVRFWSPKYMVASNGRSTGAWVGHYEIHRKGPQVIARGVGGHIPVPHGALNRLWFRDTAFQVPFKNGNEALQFLAGKALDYVVPYASNRGADIRPGSQADFGGEIRTRFASGAVDLDYLFSDLSGWWPGPKWTNANNPANATLIHDQKVLFRPASAADPLLVVLYARYNTTGTRYEPTYCWNPATEAISVDGTETANQPVRFGTGHGHWTYTGATRAIAVNTNNAGTPAYNGKNILTVIRPTSRTIVKAGGPDENGDSWQFSGPFGDDATLHPDIGRTISCEAIDYYGQRWTGNLSPGQTDLTIQHGRYHIQVQPSPIPTSGDFLLVNEVGDSTITPAACEHVVGTNFAGVAILAAYGRRIAVFGTAGDAASGSFVVPTAGTYKCLIANLLASSCAISGGANISSITAVEGGSGSPFAVSNSRTVYVTIVVAASGTGGSNTITIQGSGVPASPLPFPPSGVHIIR